MVATKNIQLAKIRDDGGIVWEKVGIGCGIACLARDIGGRTYVAGSMRFPMQEGDSRTGMRLVLIRDPA